MSLITFKCLGKTLLMLVLLNFVCDTSSLTFPRSTVAVIGNRVELKCTADGARSVIWEFISFNTSKDTNFYFGDDISLAFQSRYKIDKRISGQHNLVIDSVDLDHSGRYRCKITDTNSKTVPYTYLTVLDSSPECSANTSTANEGNKDEIYLWMGCRVAYSGYMFPIFNWMNTKAVDVILANTSTSDDRSVLFTATSSLEAQLRSNDNGVVFTCVITFQLPNNSQENAPTFEHTWTYTANVPYGPRNISIVRYEDRLECSARGNPAPKYRWTNTNTNISAEGSVLMINKELNSDRKQVYNCSAENALGTQMTNILISPEDLDVATKPASEEFRTTVIAVSVGVGSLILLVLIAVSCSVNRTYLKALTKEHVCCITRSKPIISHEPDVIDVDLYSYDSNAFRLSGNHGAVSESSAVYAEVKKGNGKEKKESTINNCSDPVYADVQKKQKGKNRVGADGTEYLDLSEVRQSVMTSTTRTASPSYGRVDYALIDHTGRAPPPPPKF